MSDAVPFFESRNNVVFGKEIAVLQDGIVIFVAGGCKGIGLQIVIRIREIMEHHPFAHSTTIFITSRNLASAQQVISEKLSSTVAVKTPQSSIKIVPLALDITNQSSIDAAKDAVMQTCNGRIDILFNNAGFAYKMADTTPFSQQATVTTNINYHGTKNVTLSLLPCLERSVLPNGARVVNVSSSAGQLWTRYSPALKAEWLAAASTESIDIIVKRFVAAAQDGPAGKHTEQGFPNSAYSVSKTAVTQLTRVLSDTIPTVNFYSCCPGLCRTDMAGGQWTTLVSVVFWAATWVVGHSAYAGAETPAWLGFADISPHPSAVQVGVVKEEDAAADSRKRNAMSGKFFRNRVAQEY